MLQFFARWENGGIMRKGILSIGFLLGVQILLLAGCDLDESRVTIKQEEQITLELPDPPRINYMANYVFSNDLSKLCFDDVAKVASEDSDVTTVLGDFVKLGDVQSLDEVTLSAYIKQALEYKEDTYHKPDATYPAQEGIYRATCFAEDSYGSGTMGYILVVYDCTAPEPVGGELGDVTFTFDDVRVPPRMQLYDNALVDNVDGDIPEEEVSLAMEEVDPVGSGVKKSYAITISYTDRAGNAFSGSFYVHIKQKVIQETPKETPKESVPAEKPAEVAAPVEESSGLSGAFNETYANEVLTLVNNERAAAGLGPLTMRYDSMAAAQIRAVETVSSFSHTRPNGSQCFTVLDETGASYRCAGENLAAGQSSPQEVVTAWMNSEGHRANILYSNYNQISITCYYDPNSYYKYYWVQLFTD